VRATQDESVSSAAVTPIADEDLLRWRAFGFRGMTEPTTPDASSAESPAVESPSVANPAADTVALPTGVPVKKDLGMGRLLSLTMPARSADSLAEPSNTAGNTSLQVAMTPGMTSVTVSALSPLSAEEAKTRDTTRTATTVSELRSRAFNVSDVESTDREADEFSQEGETPSDADRWDTQSFVAALTPRGIAGGSEQGSSSSVVAGPAAGSATPPSAELAASMNAAVIRPEAMAELPSRFRELASTSTTHLPVPDPKMTAEDRSRTFAEAVAQRVIGQIRNENWSVSLQLEPLNLGSMDIDLALRGTEVTATVGVANAEVRSMLEAGLPRLREALESSGLQLAGWSFGQSGQRARGDSSSTPYIAQAYRERADEAAIVTDVSNMAALRRGSDSSRAVDLFV
jgi:flagellar hook-length control protein FliK